MIRNNAGLILKSTIIVVVTIAFFFNDLRIVFSDAIQSETTSYILLVPILLSYLLYRKRKMLTAIMPLEKKSSSKMLKYASTITGAILFTISILVYWQGSYTFTPLEYHMFSLPLFTAGLVLILFNLQTLRQLAFPIAFLFFLTPPPSEILFTVGGTLSGMSSALSSGLVSLMGIPSTLVSEYATPIIVIARPDSSELRFVIDIACSGIYGLIGFLLFAIFIAFLIRDKILKKAALLVLGIPLMLYLNVVRITTILLLGYYFGETLALQVFHLLGGWFLIFIGALLLLTISERILKARIFGYKPKRCEECTSTKQRNQGFCVVCGRVLTPKKIHVHKSDIAKIVVIIVALTMLLSIQAPVFSLTQSQATVKVNAATGQQEFSEVLPNLPNYLLEFGYRDVSFEKTAQIDAALAYTYTSKEGSLRPIWVALEIASTIYNLHRWETCLIDYPLSQDWKPRVTAIELVDVRLAENPPIIARQFIFQRADTNQTHAVLYWYEKSIFNINSKPEERNVKISLIAYPDNPEEIVSVKNEQMNIAEAIIDFWEPIKLWSEVSLLLSENGGFLAAVATVALVAILLYYVADNAKQRKANRNSYKNLSVSNKEIVEVIRVAEKEGVPTIDSIADEYRKIWGKVIEREQLLQKLAVLEKKGIIEVPILNSGDEPIQSWKA
jgi:exosortase